tara:strand:+ start:13507 stop:14604 length:1098 start_codon:yes stop_codon:yes gene_type:complete
MFDGHTINDKTLIERCFENAKKAIGNTSPNPYVGSVIVKDGLIIADGFHKKSGQPHAEIEAMRSANQDLTGATLYCNLEPCCHSHKKTPPCTDAIIEAGIKKVVISNLDPNPAVAGKGIEQLKEAGIEVETGVLKDEGEKLNEVFFTHITKRRPFVHLKWAQTLDGKIATNTNSSKWITGETARERVHQERWLYDAVAIGSRTAVHDDPRLTIRVPNEVERSKQRIIFSRTGNIPQNLNLFKDSFKDKTLIVSAEPIEFARHILCPTKDELLDLPTAMDLLYAQGVHSLYVEGGATLVNGFIGQGLMDRLSVYISPKLLGKGIPAFHGEEHNLIESALSFPNGSWKQLGDDVVFESRRNICLPDL